MRRIRRRLILIHDRVATHLSGDADGAWWGLYFVHPGGPINLTIMNEGARRGFKHAALVGLGASTMEIIYCSMRHRVCQFLHPRLYQDADGGVQLRFSCYSWESGS